MVVLSLTDANETDLRRPKMDSGLSFGVFKIDRIFDKLIDDFVLMRVGAGGELFGKLCMDKARRVVRLPRPFAKAILSSLMLRGIVTRPRELRNNFDLLRVTANIQFVVEK